MKRSAIRLMVIAIACSFWSCSSNRARVQCPKFVKVEQRKIKFRKVHFKERNAISEEQTIVANVKGCPIY